MIINTHSKICRYSAASKTLIHLPGLEIEPNSFTEIKLHIFRKNPKIAQKSLNLPLASISNGQALSHFQCPLHGRGREPAAPPHPPPNTAPRSAPCTFNKGHQMGGDCQPPMPTYTCKEYNTYPTVVLSYKFFGYRYVIEADSNYILFCQNIIVLNFLCIYYTAHTQMSTYSNDTALRK